MEERRKDIGLKFIYITATAVISILITILLQNTYGLAQNNSEKITKTQLSIAILEQSSKETQRRLDGIDTKLDTIISLQIGKGGKNVN